MKRIALILSLIVLCVVHHAYGQQNASLPSRRSQFAEFDLAIGKSEGTAALSYNYDHACGKRQKIVVGFGARFTSYFGRDQDYITAPAQLTSGSTGPGVIFKQNIEANLDTFMVSSPQINSLNLFITLGYNLTSRLQFRFNIDAVGFSFGKQAAGTFIHNGQRSVATADPTSFNILLVSDNDKGSLNSQFIGRYLLGDRWAIKGGAQFHFTEYTTSTDVQQSPEANDRFRRKSLMFIAGISYRL